MDMRNSESPSRGRRRRASAARDALLDSVVVRWVVVVAVFDLRNRGCTDNNSKGTIRPVVRKKSTTDVIMVVYRSTYRVGLLNDITPLEPR